MKGGVRREMCLCSKELHVTRVSLVVFRLRLYRYSPLTRDVQNTILVLNCTYRYDGNSKYLSSFGSTRSLLVVIYYRTRKWL
jgi:hypothetical protein